MHMERIILYILVAILAVTLAKPAIRQETDPELIAGYVGGDMVFENLQRNGLRWSYSKWPNNIVYYKFFTQFDEPHKSYILRGMQIIEEVSCIRFKEATSETQPFLNITGFSNGCYSQVGCKNNGAQSFNLARHPLDEGCFRMGTIVHELLHTLGFLHMQSAYDRDNYVQIVMENVAEYAWGNFFKSSINETDDYDQEYDYGSVMHYSSTAFSINGENTIIALKEDPDVDEMGQRRAMSKKDINRLNVMYRCPLIN